jgi:DivIVA domain-containing protein
VRFSAAMRGYDRDAVDEYVSRVNRVLAELQITAAPESAIRHALAQVADETKGLLERAHETADEITRRSRSQADDRIQGATQEAERLREASEQEARAILGERARLIGELRELLRRLGEFADAAAGRYPSPPPPPPQEERPT